MSKRLGNVVDPFEVISQHGSDPLRWYLITNAQPWDNLKFDIEGVDEVKRKFFGTLYNTYSFFALYANVDGFTYKEAEIPVRKDRRSTDGSFPCSTRSSWRWNRITKIMNPQRQPGPSRIL